MTILYRPARVALAVSLAFAMAGSGATSAAASATVSPATAPSNNNFANAKPISSPPYTDSVDLTDATTQVNEPTPCGLAGETVWYDFHATANRRYGIDTRGSNLIATIVLYTGTSLSTLNEVECRSHDHGDAADLILNSVAGTTYRIQIGVDSDSQATANRSLVMHFVRLTKPANDLPGNARSISGIPYTGTAQDIRAATGTGDPPDNCTFKSKTVWYRYTSTKTQVLSADNLLGDFSATIAVFRGSGLSFVTCGPDNIAAFRAVKGKTYYIQIGGDSSSYGRARLRLRKVTPPGNDAFANPAAIGALPADVLGTTRNATSQPGEPQPCSNPVYSTVWFSYTAPTGQSIRVAGDSGEMSIRVAIYSGSTLTGLTPLACGPDAVAKLQAGHTYRISVGGAQGGVGAFELSITAGTAPANDNQGSAQVFTVSSPFTDQVDTNYATNESGENIAPCTSLPAGTVWYRTTASATGVIRVQTFGSNFDTVVNVWSGTPGNLQPVGCDDDSGHVGESLTSSFAFKAANGTEYWFQIGGYGSEGGDLHVAIETVTPPPNDDFGNATQLIDGFSATNIDTTTATVQAGEPIQTCNGLTQINGATVWFKFHATTNDALTFTASGTQSPVVQVYQGTSIGSLTAIGCSGGSVEWPGTPGANYRIQVTGASGRTGPLDVGFDVH